MKNPAASKSGGDFNKLREHFCKWGYFRNSPGLRFKSGGNFEKPCEHISMWGELKEISWFTVLEEWGNFDKPHFADFLARARGVFENNPPTH